MPDDPGGRVRETAASGGDSVHVQPETFAGTSAPVGSLTRYSIGGLSLSAGDGPIGVLPPEPTSVPPAELVHDVVRGVGAPLDPVVQEEMSARFGTDFSAVRVHADAGARRSAAALGARAYTTGDHIVSGAGALDRRTLAHELVHVVQQRLLPATGGSGLRVSDPADASERAAEAGGPLDGHVDAPAGGDGLLVQRQIDATAHPDAVLEPEAGRDRLHAYLDSVVDTRNGLTFARVVDDTIAAFPEESEAAGLPRLWHWLRFVLDPGRPAVVPVRFFRTGLVELADGVNSVHASIRDEVLQRAPVMYADARAAQAKVPLTAPSLSTKTDLLEKWLRSGDRDLPARDLADVRRFLADLAPEINAHSRRGRLLERSTRMGFEIETGNQLTVTKNFVTIAEKLINVTLATTDRVEFLVDDIKHTKTGATLQVEFRTRPFTRGVLEDAAELKKKIDADLANFPVMSLGKDAATFSAEFGEHGKPGKHGWTGTPQLAELAPGLAPVETSVKPAPIQHVTHSVPLARFVRLNGKKKDLLIPGTGQVTTVEQFLEFLLTKKILPQTKNGTIVVSTIGRNSHAPNVKSALDTISGFLPPARFDKLAGSAAFSRLPSKVRIRTPGAETEATGTLGPLTRHDEIPPFPSFNVERGSAHLAAEEKLAPVLFDPRLKDIRVLVEHRGDDLVNAVNDAMSGKSAARLREYLAVFKELDDLKATSLKDHETFGRWFT